MAMLLASDLKRRSVVFSKTNYSILKTADTNDMLVLSAVRGPHPRRLGALRLPVHRVHHVAHLQQPQASLSLSAHLH